MAKWWVTYKIVKSDNYNQVWAFGDNYFEGDSDDFPKLVKEFQRGAVEYNQKQNPYAPKDLYCEITNVVTYGSDRD